MIILSLTSAGSFTCANSELPAKRKQKITDIVRILFFITI
jgi:hypothetical protein